MVIAGATWFATIEGVQVSLVATTGLLNGYLVWDVYTMGNFPQQPQTLLFPAGAAHVIYEIIQDDIEGVGQWQST